jgi:hypothetical protein
MVWSTAIGNMRWMMTWSGTRFTKTVGLMCPYHAWTYDFEGKLIAAPNLTKMPDIDRDGYGLVKVHLRQYLGYVWVCLADEPPSFEEDVMGAIEERLGDVHAIDGYDVANLSLGRRIRYDVKANWKLIIENFMECYHCATIHPELTEVLPDFADGLAAQYFVGHGAEFGEDVKGFTVDGSEGLDLIPGVSEEQDRRYYAITIHISGPRQRGNEAGGCYLNGQCSSSGRLDEDRFRSFWMIGNIWVGCNGESGCDGGNQVPTVRCRCRCHDGSPPFGEQAGLVHSKNCHRIFPAVVHGKKTVLLGIAGRDVQPVVTGGMSCELDLDAVLVGPEIWRLERLLWGVLVQQCLHGKGRPLQRPGPVLNAAVPAGDAVKPCGAVSDGDDLRDVGTAHGIAYDAPADLHAGAVKPFNIGVGADAHHNNVRIESPTISQANAGDFAVCSVELFDGGAADQVHSVNRVKVRHHGPHVLPQLRRKRHLGIVDHGHLHSPGGGYGSYLGANEAGANDRHA